MKVLFCPECHDVFRLQTKVWRICKCHQSGGMYVNDRDGLLGGKAKVFGVGNYFFHDQYKDVIKKSDSVLKKYREACGVDQRSECWWGEYEGDEQIERCDSAYGPDNISKIYTFENRNRLRYAFQVLFGNINIYGMVKNLRLMLEQMIVAENNDMNIRKKINDVEWLKDRLREVQGVTEVQP